MAGPVGYIDGYSDSGTGSSGQLPQPPPGSSWSNKPTVGKGQVSVSLFCNVLDCLWLAYIKYRSKEFVRFSYSTL